MLDRLAARVADRLPRPARPHARWLLDAGLLALAVWGYLRVGPAVPTPEAATYDNRTMAVMTAAIANGDPVYVWVGGSQDPWLRYVPQALVAVLLPQGEISLVEALRVNAYYVFVAEAVAFPVGAYDWRAPWPIGRP